ncbi:unnamed protein product [Phyllotreta striolata]|uniref:D-isomer specific 2-hydroxyacid dehydrogenase NAD-binding domain-containing protein n=1 Tax=Phyllotreta striolata TaxID=444603 RepID=A0A9N9XRN3_PHYSR|nr:unnamed protein product [Phyllotreta striolata]
MSSSVISVLTRFTNLPDALRKCVPTKIFHHVENPATDTQFRQSEIIISDSDLLVNHINNLPKVKWIQTTWAGVESLTNAVDPSEPPKFPVTRFTGKYYGHFMSEYCVAQIINFERHMKYLLENQKSKIWEKNELTRGYRALFELTVGIMGLGNIGLRVGKTLHMMGCNVIGYGRRSNFDSEKNNFVSMYFSGNDLRDMLRKCDYVINLLPNTKVTTGFLNGDVLANCAERGAVFINVGRGSVISEDSLMNALKNKWISGAILDVIDREPLPSSSPLWDLPNVIITPHVSCVSRVQDMADQFKENLALYEQQLPIPYTIDFVAGY